MLAVGLLLLVTLSIRQFASRSLLLAWRVEQAWELQQDTGDALVVDVSQLDEPNYRRFARAVRCASEFDVPVVVKLPDGLTLPRAWSALASSTPLRAMTFTPGTIRSRPCD
jgi:hypothetical protein